MEIKEDLKIDRRKGYENFKFSIADLNLATLIEVYEQVYFNVTDITGETHLSVVNYDVSYENTVFMVSLYATGLSGDISYNVTGVDATDVSGSLTSPFLSIHFLQYAIHQVVNNLFTWGIKYLL